MLEEGGESRLEILTGCKHAIFLRLVLGVVFFALIFFYWLHLDLLDFATVLRELDHQRASPSLLPARIIFDLVVHSVGYAGSSHVDFDLARLLIELGIPQYVVVEDAGGPSQIVPLVSEALERAHVFRLFVRWVPVGVRGASLRLLGGPGGRAGRRVRLRVDGQGQRVFSLAGSDLSVQDGRLDRRCSQGRESSVLVLVATGDTDRGSSASSPLLICRVVVHLKLTLLEAR